MSTKVLVSRGYGAGWSTWNRLEVALDEGLVALFEEGATSAAKEAYAVEKWPDAYLGGLLTCDVEEVPTGSHWRINEYDGSEHLEVLSLADWRVG